MKKSKLIKASILAVFAIVVLGAFSLTNSEAEPKKCCMKECKPEPKACKPDYLFYESLNGHLIFVPFKQ